MTVSHFVFLAVGVILVLVAILLRLLVGTTVFWRSAADLAWSVGISVMVVSIVDFLWRKLGGDPIAAALSRLQNTTSLLEDLGESGVQRVHTARNKFEGKEGLLTQMKVARRVDMMGMTLQHGWANDPDFLRILKERAGRDRCHFRIMVFSPDGAMVRQRDREEASQYDGQPTRISNDAFTSLQIFSRIRDALPEEEQGYLQLRVVVKTNLYCSVIRVDESMLVSKYMMSCRGSRAPSLEISGAATPFFKIYEQEFEAVWDLAADWPLAE